MNRYIGYTFVFLAVSLSGCSNAVRECAWADQPEEVYRLAERAADSQCIVVGQVISEDGDLLPGVVVTLQASERSSSTAVAITDKNGHFWLAFEPRGERVDLTFEMAGMRIEKKSFIAAAGGRYAFCVRLQFDRSYLLPVS